MSSVEVKEELNNRTEFKQEPSAIITALVLLGVFLGSYMFVIENYIPRYFESNSIISIYRAWWTPDYQHGFFVLPFCAFLLWYRRDMMTSALPKEVGGDLRYSAFGRPCGSSAPISSLLIRIIYRSSPGVAAIVLFVGGWQAIRWSWPALLFMAFMIPLPGYLTNFLSQPLQSIGCRCSVFLIQTMGIASLRRETTFN